MNISDSTSNSEKQEHTDAEFLHLGEISAVPNSAHGPTEPDKADETYSVTNVEFLGSIFGADLVDELPMLVSFDGNPNSVSRGAWSGQAWRGDSDPAMTATANNYFSISTFRPDDAGMYRRKKSQFTSVRVVVLDDVGTKVDLTRVTLKPSYMLETSAGNFQVGYILDEPLTDGVTADRLINQIISAHLCDPGAGGPRARLVRLPVGVNGKHAPPFQCRLDEWSPALRYSVDELINGLQLDALTTGPRETKTKKKATKKDSPKAGDPISTPKPDHNVVLAALQAKGLYKAPLGDGKHDISCPWVGEHTDQVDGGAAYFEPDDTYPIGGFKCFHGHCASRRVSDLLILLGVTVESARMRPTIRVVPGEIHRVVNAGEVELAQSPRIFQRGGLIVTVITDPGTRETRIQDFSNPALVRELAGVASWERYDARSGEWHRVDPPARHSTVLHDSPSYPHLRVLNGLSRQPYLRPDGSLMTAPGYDPTTGMFGVFNPRDFSVPDKPTRAEAEAALALIKGLLSEFSFAGANDMAAALAAILTASIRSSLPNAPMIHVRAHTLGSGKSYLCQLITAFATPQRGTPMTFPGDDEEMRKLLLAELMRGPAVIEFDNLTSELVAHKSLCIALTSEHMTGRILGISKTANVSTRSLFLSSGNNVGPVQDMTRRCVTIDLDPGVENPAARKFKRPDLVRDVLSERGKYISAALTIVRAWIEAGRPKAECKAVGSFGDWSDLCRQPLLWLGLADPTASVFAAMAEDPERELLGRLLAAWHAIFGNSSTMIRDVINPSTNLVGDLASVMKAEELKEILLDIAGEKAEINRLKLGRWIKRQAGRIVNGQRFSGEGGHRSARAWRVESVSSVSSGSATRTEESVVGWNARV